MKFFNAGRGVAGAVAVAILCTCGTLDRFDVGTSASATIPKASLLEELIGLVDFPGFDELDFSQQIANQGVSEDQIDSVRLTSFVIHTEGSGATLDFIESASFYAEADDLPRILVASSTDFAGQTSVELDLEEDAELKPYVVAPSMTLSAEVKGKKPQQDTKLTADVTLTIDATIPGCE